MFYTKNVPGWERVLRGALGIGMVLYGLLGMKGTMLGYGVAAMGIVAIGTGSVGFCPMCALAGRRIARKAEINNSAAGGRK